jgi:DNA-binding GntR family transcriptional regulator
MPLFDGPIAQQKTSLAVADMIRDAILRGQLVPGQRLKEDHVANELNVSRTPVREALVILEMEGMVESSRGRGATVKEYTNADLDEIYELRGVLEGYGAFRAATRISPEQLDTLHKSCDRLAALERDDLAGLVAENALFHSTVLEAAQSERLTDAVIRMRAVPLQYHSYARYTPDQLQHSIDAHRGIVDALEAGDADLAGDRMREHASSARSVLRDGFTKPASGEAAG